MPCRAPWLYLVQCSIVDWCRVGPPDAAADGGLPGRQSWVHRVLRHQEGRQEDDREVASAPRRYLDSIKLVFVDYVFRRGGTARSRAVSARVGAEHMRSALVLAVKKWCQIYGHLNIFSDLLFSFPLPCLRLGANKTKLKICFSKASRFENPVAERKKAWLRNSVT